jgi:hypothetical protein
VEIGLKAERNGAGNLPKEETRNKQVNGRTKLLSVLLSVIVLISLTMACTLPGVPGVGGPGVEEQTPAPPPPPPAETATPTSTTVATATPISTEVPPTATPVPSTGTPILPTVAPGELSQWAISAVASSEYSSPEWSAQQATGAPDTPECGDYQTAWATESYDGVDWLEVGYATPVRPVRINIHETNSPGFIVRVEVKDEGGMYHTVWQGTPGALDQCPRILSVPVTGIESRVVAVRINLDQRAGGDWDEIDAVELIGQP